MQIIISNSSSLPIYEQISNQIKKSIISDELDEGQLLPSIRKLAKDLQVSVITTKRAYEVLEHEGLVESVRGKGFFVATKNKALIKEKKLRLIEEKLQQAIDECKLMGISEQEVVEMIKLLFID